MAEKKKGARARSTSGAQKSRQAEGYGGEHELIVIARPEVRLRARRDEVASLEGVDVAPLEKVLKNVKAQLVPLFGTEDRVERETAEATAAAVGPLPSLSAFYRVEAPEDTLDDVAAEMLELDLVEAAYVKPPAEPAEAAEINVMEALPEEAPSSTPDFTARQIYLNAVPAGVDARHAWTLSGGRGAGVGIIDIEGAWRFSHEDLLQNQGGVIGGTQSTNLGWRNHGTAVVGVFGADRNTFGCTGIAPDAHTRAISIFGGVGSANAIRQAANALNPGDIILIELHRAGPRHNFQPRSDQQGYIAIEWWPDDFAATQFATGRGVLVVAAAGNGREDLDDPIYSTRPAGFPSTWTNPFNRANRDSGSIIVGAGAPPPGTHGRDHGPDRSRLGFSNFGALVDAQGWGREVTTCGYGDLQGGSDEDAWYTDRFSGTSSASPIVVGALACVQGRLRALGRSPLTPAQARGCLRTTGSPQQDAPGRPATQRIGNRPDIRALLRCAIGPIVKKGEGKEFKEFKEIKEGKELKERRKELKDLKERRKEFKDLKERPKELKDLKERPKELKEPKEIVEKQRELLHRLERVTEAAEEEEDYSVTLRERVSALEQTVDELVHFIGSELRPDLSTSALSEEADREATMRAELEKNATDSKQAKDFKDVEKPREY